MPATTLVIVNPRSRSGATGRRWADVEARLREALGDLEVERTRGPRDAERIAREGVRAGVERIVVAGGDGTVSEVVTGLLSAGLGRYACIGLLPLGTGADLARTLGVPRDLDEAIRRLAVGKERRIDAGRARYRRTDGRDHEVYFVNVAGLGLSGLVTQLINRATHRLGSTFAYLSGTLRGLARWRNADVTLHLDGQLLHQGPLVEAAAANGRTFGAGMRVAPHAEPDDGWLDVIVIPGFPKRTLLRHLPKLYRGTHLTVPGVLEQRGRVLEATSDETVWIELDGEPLGVLPARFELVPGAVRIFGAGE